MHMKYGCIWMHSRYQVPGSRYWVLGTRHQVLGTRHLVAARYQVDILTYCTYCTYCAVRTFVHTVHIAHSVHDGYGRLCIELFYRHTLFIESVAHRNVK